MTIAARSSLLVALALILTAWLVQGPHRRFTARAAALVGTVGLALGPAMPGAGATSTTPAAPQRSVTTSAAGSAVAIAGWPDGLGYWVATAVGGVDAAGGAQFYGSMAGRQLNARVVGIAASPTGRGYWLVAADGSVYTFGAAHYYGSMAGHHLLHPVVGMATTPDGKGYWLVAADGGVFSFGDARFWGSVPETGIRITDAISLVPANTGAGYYVETPTSRYPFGAVYPNVPAGGKAQPAAPIVGAAPIFRGLCLVNVKGTVVVYHTVAVYHSAGMWSEQLAIPRPVAIASTAVSQNLFVLDALGRVKMIDGPGPPPGGA